MSTLSHTVPPDLLAWVPILGLLLATITHHHRPRPAVTVAVLAWSTFAGFMAYQIPAFAVGMHSPISTIGAMIAGGASLVLASRLATTRAAVLMTLTRAVAIGGTLYLIAATLHPVRTTLIETVAAQTHTLLALAGIDHALVVHPGQGLHSQLEFSTAGHTYATHLVFACTGAGALAGLAGVIAVIDRPLGTRITVLAAAGILVWVLNVIRNAFIAVAFGHQWFQLAVDPILTITGYRDPALVSYLVADRLIAQPVAVVVLTGILIALGNRFSSLRTTIITAMRTLTGSHRADRTNRVEP